MRSSLHLPKLLAATAAACALVPAAANAATLTFESGGYVYRGNGSEGISVLVADNDEYTENGNVHVLTFGESGAGQIDIQTDQCHPGAAYEKRAICVYDPSRPITIVGSDGNDSISLFSASSVPDSQLVNIDGRGGNDQIKDTYNGQAGRTLLGGAGNDKIEGYGGDDVIDGGDGQDEVDGGEGNDTVRGGAGDDTMWGDHYKTPGADVLDGGPGHDTIDEWNDPSGDYHPMPAISQDGVANDGRPGENDNVTNIEKFDLHINATFAGGGSDEQVEIHNVDEGSSNLSGNGGNDILKGEVTNDTVDGGAGDDNLEGGLGNDKITGGPGKDTIMGDSSSSYCTYLGDCKVPFGADEIWAKDGEADTIDCGVGEDTAHVDAIDTVQNCEKVDGQSGGGGTTPGGGGTAPGGGGTTPGGGSAAKLSVLGAAKVKTLLSGKLTVSVPCAAACRVTVNAKKGGKTVATGGATLLAGGTAKARLKVSAKNKRALKRTKKLNLTITATITGADGQRQKLTRAVKLK